MSLRRIGVLLSKDFIQGPKNFIFIYAIVFPVVISLVLSVVFGTLFAETPKLGISDEGNSQLTGSLAGLDSIISKEYATTAGLKEAVESGAVDMGIVLPQGFDSAVSRGEITEITAYIWGESLAKNRGILGVIIVNQVRDQLGQAVPLEIEAVNLGDAESIPWEDRILPMIILYAVIIGGAMLPATALVEEKQKRTLKALLVTPVSLEEVYVSKGLLGVILSLFMGVFVLILNQAFGVQPFLLIMVLALGSLLAASFGLILGAFAKNITTLFATIKLLGIVLFGPAIVFLFPEIPQWIGRIFPTYYIIQPVVEITQQGGTWPDVALEVFILIGFILAGFAAVALVLRRLKRQEI
jgi:ABC-2 type transport system permease protein